MAGRQRPPQNVTNVSPSRGETIPADGRAQILAIEGLSFAYPDGRQALEDIHLSLDAGEKVALVGPNGAGKSTLLLHLNGILQGVGRIRIGDLPVVPENHPEVRARVGLVFQNPDDQLFSPTVFEDVAYGPMYMGHRQEEVGRRVKWALDQVGMAEHGDRLSHHLSAGEKKRVAIATVLSMDPEILALDEPTAGLDPRGRRALIELLDGLPLALLIATHDMALVAELTPRVVILDEGRVVADGPSRALLHDRPLLEAHGLEAPPFLAS